ACHTQPTWDYRCRRACGSLRSLAISQEHQAPLSASWLPVRTVPSVLPVQRCQYGDVDACRSNYSINPIGSVVPLWKHLQVLPGERQVSLSLETVFPDTP